MACAFLAAFHIYCVALLSTSTLSVDVDRMFESVCLSVCLFVCPEYNSETNDPQSVQTSYRE